MGDPGLVPGDHPGVPLTHRPRAQRAEVGAGVGLGEDRRRQDLGRRDPRQPFLLLRLGAAAEDQLRRDLRARPERADADVAARQFLRDHAHRRLRHAGAAVLLGDGQAEDPEPPHLLDDRQRDQLVLQVPLVGEGHDLVVGEAPELVADHLVVLVEPGRPEAGTALGRHHQRNETRPGAVAVAAGDQRLDGGRAQRRGRGADVGRADDLELRHRNAARKLRQVLAEGDLEDQRLDLAEGAGRLEPPGPPRHLLQRLGIGRHPREPVRRRLLGLQRLARDLAAAGHPRGDRHAGGVDQRLCVVRRGIAQRQQVGQERGLGRQGDGGFGHRGSRSLCGAESAMLQLRKG